MDGNCYLQGSASTLALKEPMHGDEEREKGDVFFLIALGRMSAAVVLGTAGTLLLLSSCRDEKRKRHD